MEDIASPIDNVVWVNDQGDQYVPTDLYEHMDSFGWIQPRTMGEYLEVHDIYGWKPRSIPLPIQKLDAEVSV